MCLPTMLAALGVGGAGATAATAAGATAGAATAVGTGSLLSALGTGVSIFGSLMQGAQARDAANEQAAHIENQRQTENALNAVRDQRSRKQFRSAIAQQRAELVSRGVNLNSPTAVFLGQTAAREMAFDSQSIRTTGQACNVELSSQAQFARAKGAQSMLRGTVNAVGTLFKAAPDIWPGLMA